MPEITSFKIAYELTDDQLRLGLQLAGRIKNNQPKNIICTLVLICLMPIFAFQYIFVSRPNYPLGVVLIVFCAAFAVFVWVYPQKHEKEIVENARRGQFNLELSAEQIKVAEAGKDPYTVLLDGQIQLYYKKEVMVLFIAGGKLLILPEEAFKNKDDLETARKWIAEGTRPRAV